MGRKTTAERLIELMNYFDIKQNDLCQKTGIPKSAMSMYISGQRSPRQDRLSDIAEAYGVSETWLMGYDVPMKSGNTEYLNLSNIYPVKVHKLPMLGDIACGEPIFMSEEQESYCVSGTEARADFCLRAKGDSMINARIMDGDIVFIRQQPEVENGEIAAVAIDDEATLKRFYRDEETGTITLVAENPAYAPKVFTADNQKNVYILGKAVAFQSDIK